MNENNFNLHGFRLHDILDDCNSRNDVDDEINYLKYVLYSWQTREEMIDPNGRLYPSFEKRIELEIEARMGIANFIPPKEKPPIPKRKLKECAKSACEYLIENNIITEELEETKKDKLISPQVIEVLKTDYTLTGKNERSIHEYFRKPELQIKKNKNGDLIVLDNYCYKNKKG